MPIQFTKNHLERFRPFEDGTHNISPALLFALCARCKVISSVAILFSAEGCSESPQYLCLRQVNAVPPARLRVNGFDWQIRYDERAHRVEEHRSDFRS